MRIQPLDTLINGSSRMLTEYQFLYQGVPGSVGSGSNLEKVGLGGSQEEQKKMPNSKSMM